MSKVIAIVGAGPGVGLAVARKFGQEGFKVALLSRDTEKLDSMASQLNASNIEAAVFAADVLDRPGLTAELNRVIERFGKIDVLQFSPTMTPDTLRTPIEIDVENEQFHLDFSVLGAITSVRTVLPQMLERGDGGLLFTTAASAQYPVTFTASFGVAAGALLNYVRVLNQELTPKGIHAGIVSIAGLVVQEGDENRPNPKQLPLVTAQDIAEIHWNLYTKRDRAEVFAGDINRIMAMTGH
jgi:NADP-dependent 3-hydroxy acid dehydrogenase YdfG